MCALLGAIYTAIGVVIVGRLLDSARAPRDARADVNGTRIFFVGGLMSYRALFGWLSPWIFIPTFLVAPDLPDPALRLHRPLGRACSRTAST